MIKQLIALTISAAIVYGLSSVLAGNWNAFEWHWSMRLIAVVWVIASWSHIIKNDSDNIR